MRFVELLITGRTKTDKNGTYEKYDPFSTFYPSSYGKSILLNNGHALSMTLLRREFFEWSFYGMTPLMWPEISPSGFHADAMLTAAAPPVADKTERNVRQATVHLRQPRRAAKAHLYNAETSPMHENWSEHLWTSGLMSGTLCRSPPPLNPFRLLSIQHSEL